MAPTLKTLPLIERWDCHSCSICCRGSTIVLNPLDRQKLAEQAWHQDPDLRGVRTVVREGLLGGRRVLAKQADGSCIFLTDKGRCRIHEQHGPEAKPAICQLFPLQVVPLGKLAYLTPRRACPSAAADRGRPVSEQVKTLKRSGLLDPYLEARTRSPRIAGRVRRSWPEFLVAADALSGLLNDPQFPLVRRVVHGLRYCELLDRCKLHRVEEGDWGELTEMLAASAAEGAGEFFRERIRPSASTGLLFRQLGVHYIRVHPGFSTSGGWKERWRMVRALSKFARGKGAVPSLQDDFPPATFDELERPLGPLPAEITQPLERFFETHAMSKQYAVVTRGQSLVESFRALALTFPMALWLVRLACGAREPAVDDMIQIVVALDRGQGSSSVRRASTAMADTHQLHRLIAWYAR